MEAKPFWQKTYADKEINTFQKGPTKDIAGFHHLFKPNSSVLDVGCGEDRNSIFLSVQGHIVDAFYISSNGIAKAAYLSDQVNANVHFFVQDFAAYQFNKNYDVILSHGVFHLTGKKIRNYFLERMKAATATGGFNVVGIFTNRLPATPDNAPFAKNLFDVGELPRQYDGWGIVYHEEGTFEDTHPGGIHHMHAFERIIARKNGPGKI
ncbi:MAG: methyltransferase domain-containing protein [Spirochaetales bacterium]|nr:methyltransferase domain-containing protein [Spirochaetales bacterium]